MRYSGGWVKINRSITDIDPKLYGPYFLLKSWALIQDSSIAKVDQIATSIGELSEKLKVRPTSMRKYLLQLEKYGLIKQQIINKRGRIITMLNEQSGTNKRAIGNQATWLIGNHLLKKKKEKN